MRPPIAGPQLVLSLLLVIALISLCRSELGVVTVTGDTLVKIDLDVFVELFGVGTNSPGFILILAGVILIIVLLIIAAEEYNIYRRKKLLTLFRRSE